MATYDEAVYDSFVAAADYSAKQYFCVRAGSVAGDMKLGTGACGPGIIGILQDEPEAGEAGLVCLLGITKATASGAVVAGTATAIAYGDMLIAAGSDGRLRPNVTASSICNAIALETVSSGGGGVIKVLLLPGIGVHTAADNVP